MSGTVTLEPNTGFINTEHEIPEDELRDLFAQIVARLSEKGEQVLNVDLLRRSLVHITVNPEQHDQGLWAREAENGEMVGCLAYHVVTLAGHQVCKKTGTPWHVVPYGSAGYKTICWTATHELNLTEDQAYRLFAPTATLDDLWARAAQFTHGEITRTAAMGGASSAPPK